MTNPSPNVSAPAVRGGDRVLIDGTVPATVIAASSRYGWILVRPDGDTDHYPVRAERITPAPDTDTTSTMSEGAN